MFRNLDNNWIIVRFKDGGLSFFSFSSLLSLFSFTFCFYFYLNLVKGGDMMSHITVTTITKCDKSMITITT